MQTSSEWPSHGPDLGLTALFGIVLVNLS
ncbi:protein of unknown function [Nitrospina watsonii]|uniref:Uncharacterized protein n=1 Tax=Nitrospina watsonii TaxID=1323948 RepID=A0ABM9HBI3_9BACT|nr:protein of unknown function [Nitrospina watsonii]